MTNTIQNGTTMAYTIENDVKMIDSNIFTICRKASSQFEHYVKMYGRQTNEVSRIVLCLRMMKK